MTRLAPAALTALLAALGLLNSFGSDMVIPALPSLRAELKVSAWEAQQVVSLFFGACAVMSLGYGPLADAWGRRPVILGALAIMLLGAIGCLFASTIVPLWVLRTVQGLASAAGLVISRTIVRDLYRGRIAQDLLSRIMMVQTASLLLAPLVGGWLAQHWGWRAVFAALLAILLALLLACWRWLPETLPAGERRPLAPAAIWRAYRDVMRDGTFLRLSLAHVANWVGMALYVFAAPVVVMRHWGMNEAATWLLFAPLSLGLFGGFWLFPRLLRRHGECATLRLAYGALAAAVTANLMFCDLLAPGLVHTLPLFAYAFGLALALPILLDWALTPVHSQAATAASCQTFLQFAAMALVAGVLAPLLWASPTTLALGAAGLTAIGAGALGLEFHARGRDRSGLVAAWRPADQLTATAARHEAASPHPTWRP